jgi:hypothetical protein
MHKDIMVNRKNNFNMNQYNNFVKIYLIYYKLIKLLIFQIKELLISI